MCAQIQKEQGFWPAISTRKRVWWKVNKFTILPVWEREDWKQLATKLQLFVSFSISWGYSWESRPDKSRELRTECCVSQLLDESWSKFGISPTRPNFGIAITPPFKFLSQTAPHKAHFWPPSIKSLNNPSKIPHDSITPFMHSEGIW